MSYLETLHLVHRTDFDRAPRLTVIINRHGTVGVKHRDGTWYESGCSDPADPAWFRDMTGAQVIVWGGNTDHEDPWWGQITCPSCNGSGWYVIGEHAYAKACQACDTTGVVQVGVKANRRPTVPIDEECYLQSASRKWEVEVEALADHYDPQQRVTEEQAAS